MSSILSPYLGKPMYGHTVSAPYLGILLIKVNGENEFTKIIIEIKMKLETTGILFLKGCEVIFIMTDCTKLGQCGMGRDSTNRQMGGTYETQPDVGAVSTAPKKGNGIFFFKTLKIQI